MIPTTLILAVDLDPTTGTLCALGRDHNGELHVDRQIRQCLAEKRHPVLVVGAHADDLLRTSELVGQCEFVFDPNAELGLLSQLRAGALAANRPCFFVKAETELSRPLPWSYFISEFDQTRDRENHILSPVQDFSKLATAPGLITRLGLDFLTDHDVSELVDKADELKIRAVEL